jgi:hypothetical protein
MPLLYKNISLDHDFQHWHCPDASSVIRLLIQTTWLATTRAKILLILLPNRLQTLAELLEVRLTNHHGVAVSKIQVSSLSWVSEGEQPKRNQFHYLVSFPIWWPFPTALPGIQFPNAERMHTPAQVEMVIERRGPGQSI